MTDDIFKPGQYRTIVRIVVKAQQKVVLSDKVGYCVEIPAGLHIKQKVRTVRGFCRSAAESIRVSGSDLEAQRIRGEIFAASEAAATGC
jgi:hypothetical protein